MTTQSNESLGKIKCPSCGTIITITEALQNQLTEKIREELENKINLEKEALSTRGAELKKKEAELDKSKQDIDHKVQELLKQEKTKLAQDLLNKAKEDVSIELKDLHERIKEKDQKLEAAQTTELALRKKERELEDSKKSLELEVARKISAEREKIEEDAIKKVTEERRLKEKEKDKQIADMLRQIEDLKRKAEQGSQQLQGEVQELDLESFLKDQFPLDDVQPVPKGITGADVIQKVNTRGGAFCGTIVWESKRTKSWSNGWIDKLKEDQRSVKAEIAVLVTEALPKEIQSFGLKDGIWVTNYASIPGLVSALREGLVQVSRTKQAVAGKDEKMEFLFSYLTGPQFKQRVEAIIEAFKTMKEELEEEKRIITKRWSKREKQIERVIFNTAGMYGDLQGLIGSSLQSIPSLESGEEDLESEGGSAISNDDPF